MTDNIISHPVVFHEGEKPDSVISAMLYQNTPTKFDHLEIEHDGTLTWHDGQRVKNLVFGEEAVCFELYPPQEFVVNGQSTEFHYRHIWVWPRDEPWPNIRPELL